MQPASPRRRRFARLKHRLRRELERGIRLEALAFERWCRLYDLRRSDAAGRLRISAAALAAWERGWKLDRLEVRARGRPAGRADRGTRNLVIALFHLMGPDLGVPTLKRILPQVPRRELEDLVRRYRFVYRQRRIRSTVTLRWTRPGAVWAMDFTEAPLPVDDEYPYILVVRDLASGNALASLPVRAASSDEVCALLRALFVQHGAPLVLKSDNGSALVAQTVTDLIGAWGTLALVSPPGTPRYNGACEAGIGGLKMRAHHQSARFGRAGEWTCDDVEVARLMANETGRPWGLAAPTPDEAWHARQPIAAAERVELQLAVERERQEVIKDSSQDAMPSATDRRAWASIDRIAITQALIALGYLKVRRRRITSPG